MYIILNKIYYAHHLWKYNTPIEEYELNVIKRYFPYHEIINPNGYIEQNRDEEIIMNYYLLKTDTGEYVESYLNEVYREQDDDDCPVLSNEDEDGNYE